MEVFKVEKNILNKNTKGISINVENKTVNLNILKEDLNFKNFTNLSNVLDQITFYFYFERIKIYFKVLKDINLSSDPI